MLKDRAQKILNLKKKDPKKKLCQPEPTRKTRGLSDRTKIDEQKENQRKSQSLI